MGHQKEDCVSGFGKVTSSKLLEVDVGGMEDVVTDICIPIPLDKDSTGSFVGKFVETLPSILKFLSLEEILDSVPTLAREVLGF